MMKRILLLLLLIPLLLTSCSLQLDGLHVLMPRPSDVDRVGLMPRYLHVLPDEEMGTIYYDHFNSTLSEYEANMEELDIRLLKFGKAPKGVPIVLVQALVLKEVADTAEFEPGEVVADDIARAYNYVVESEVVIKTATMEEPVTTFRVVTSYEPTGKRQSLWQQIFGPKMPVLEEIEEVDESIFVRLVQNNARETAFETARQLKKHRKELAEIVEEDKSPAGGGPVEILKEPKK